MCNIYNKRDANVPTNAVYVGRPTKWGNPFSIGKDGSRDEVIAKYEAYLLSNPELLEQVRTELYGRDLVCWCAPQRCHAEILRFFANFYDSESE